MNRDARASQPGKKPVVLGLTGSIGMGKSATAKAFATLGVPVHDSDAAVHALYEPGGAAAKAIGPVYPAALRADGGIDRARLREVLLQDPEAMASVEQLVHPLVRAESDAFVERHVDAPLVVLDIPLLYETGAETRCDAVLVVTAPPEVQRTRVLQRAGMDETTFERILARQMPDAEKRARADFVIDTSLGFTHAAEAVAEIVERLSQRSQSGP